MSEFSYDNLKKAWESCKRAVFRQPAIIIHPNEKCFICDELVLGPRGKADVYSNFLHTSCLEKRRHV